MEQTKEQTQPVITYTVDSFANGIAFGQHRLEADQDARDYYSLRLADQGDLVKLRSRYALHQEDPLKELERHLMRLSSQGKLRSSTIYFGVTTDPFHPFPGKFDGSMKFLELFKKYTPGLLVVQTRSPLVVIAMPVLQKLGGHAVVTMGIETCSQEACHRFTPSLPRVDERIKAARALKRFGVEVTVQISPVLPYGDWKQDANKFAETIADVGNYVHVLPINHTKNGTSKSAKNSALAKRLADDRQFFYLRHDSAAPLVEAIERINPKLLLTPERPMLKSKQMKMFAA